MQNPMPVLIVFIIANAVFVTVGGLFRLLTQLLTFPGLLLVLLLGILLAIRRVASLMTFPGQLKLVIREGEANFARLTKRRLQIFIEAANELATVLDPTTGTKVMRLRFLQVHQNFTFAFETLMLPVMQSLEIMDRSTQLGKNGAKLLRILRDLDKINAQEMSTACSKLCAASDKTFEAQLSAIFQDENKTESTLKTREHSRMNLFGNLSKPALKRSTTVDTASREAEAAAKLKPTEAAHTLVSFTMALRRLQNAMMLIGRPQSDTPSTRTVTWILRELCRGSSPEYDSIATLEMLRADMTVRFKAEQVWISGYQNHQVDAMLMPPATGGREAINRPVVILCNPNGGLYELHHLQMDWIKFYTSELNCHVLVYNYRGYGRCKGSPCPRLHNLDGLAIVEYLKNERGLQRIAVHGESIGGLVATYLARHSPHVNVLIADRTFSTLPALAERMIARWAGNAVELIMRWETDNVQNYVHATCAKLLCSDPGDDIILDGASLKSGVALRFELKDQTLTLPRQRKSDGSPSSLSPTSTIQKLRSRCGARSARRVSEAACLPQLGEPLNETMTARFSDAVLSIGRRAFAYTIRRDKKQAEGDGQSVADATRTAQQSTTPSHVVISLQEVEGGSVNEDDQEQHSMLSTELDDTVTSAFPEELLAVIWMVLARLDGYCGQVLLQAAENGGYDKIRAWTASLLTWGGYVAPERRNVRSIEPFDRNGIVIVPIMVAEARGMLLQLVEQYPPLKFDYDISFVVMMMEYLKDALEQRWRQIDSNNTELKQVSNVSTTKQDKTIPLVIKSDNPNLGWLLPLHCGHNKNYDDLEKEALTGFLRHVGFLESTK
ncbi:putative alpha/beta hydrolase-1 [Plasmopara halstedii]